MTSNPPFASTYCILPFKVSQEFWQILQMPTLKASWHTSAPDKPSKGFFFSLTVWSTSKTLTCAAVQIIFLLNYFRLRKNKECDTNKGLLHPKKQSGYLLACRGGNKARDDFTSNYKHSLIKLIRLGKKKTHRKTWKVRSTESSQEWSSLQQKKSEELRGSSLQARAELSRNKRGMTPLMKGRELTRIALAQCAHSFCQSGLQRYNKVHGYNEAWAHLSLNCVESLP